MPASRPRPAILLAVSELHPETQCAHGLIRDGHYRNAIREASEQFLVRLKRLAEESERPDVQGEDGSRLVGRMFAEPTARGGPVLVFNELATATERDEHNGYRLLALGMTQALRNALTHDPTGPEIDPAEALEWLGFISAMHRRLDDATFAGPPETRPVDLGT